MAIDFSYKEKGAAKRLGRYVADRRAKSGLSLARLAVRIGVNPSFLSEVERGNKVPDDEFIRNFAAFFQIDENDLFEMLDRVPLMAREELENQTMLQKVLKELGGSKLSNRKKQEIYEQFYQIYTKVAGKIVLNS